MKLSFPFSENTRKGKKLRVDLGCQLSYIFQKILVIYINGNADALGINNEGTWAARGGGQEQPWKRRPGEEVEAVKIRKGVKARTP